MLRVALPLLPLLLTVAAAQTPDTRPTFDAVSVRQIEASQRTSTAMSSGYIFTRHQSCVYSDDKVLCQLSLDELIREAYQRKRYEVSEPRELGEDLFVFQALLTDKTGKPEARLMMQRALEDRFGLRSHMERKATPVYLLVAGPGGQHLTPADPPERQKKLDRNGHPGSTVASSLGSFAAVAMGLDDLGPWIERQAGLERPIVNGTGLEGKYRFDLHWDPDDSDAPGAQADRGILRALEKQAGLVLRKQDLPMDILVIDHVNRTPTPNP